MENNISDKIKLSFKNINKIKLVAALALVLFLVISLSIMLMHSDAKAKIEILTLTGTWFTGLAAVFAACVSIWMAKRPKTHMPAIKTFIGYTCASLHMDFMPLADDYDLQFPRLEHQISFTNEGVEKIFKSEAQFALKISIENRGEVKFRTDDISVGIKNGKRIPLCNVLDISNVPPVLLNYTEPGECRTFIFPVDNIFKTPAQHAFMNDCVVKNEKLYASVITGFECMAEAQIQNTFNQYIKMRSDLP